MSIADEIAVQANLLPREAQIEVLDFVGFLLTKYNSKSPSEEEAWEQAAPEAEEHPAPVPR